MPDRSSTACLREMTGMTVKERLLLFCVTLLCAGCGAAVTMAAVPAGSVAERPRIIVVGNPLLDVVASVGPEFLRRYQLTPRDGVLMTEAQQGIYEELVDKYSPAYVPGGSGLNTARLMKALWKESGDVAYLGAVGDDAPGRVLEELAMKGGLETHFQKVPDMPTGRCAVLVVGQDRTLCTEIGAAQKITVSPKEEGMMREFAACYFTSYVLNSTPDGIFRLVKRCIAESKLSIFSFSSAFSVISQKDAINKLLPDVNIVFGNNDEFTHLAKESGLLTLGHGTPDSDEADKRACLAVFNLMNGRGESGAATTAEGAQASHMGQRVKMALMTRAEKPVMIAEVSPTGETAFHTVPVPPVPTEEIVDTTGAGDAFAGGFLSLFMKGHDTRKAALFGSRVAGRIIRCTGFCLEESNIQDVQGSQEAL